MRHELIVSPFLDGYLALRPGSTAGARLPEAGYEELRALADTSAPAPSWFAGTAASVWSLDLGSTPFSKSVLVRERSSYGFSEADTAAATIATPVVVPVADLDDVMDSVKCSCNAGDDNPH
jgi:hypothetical protein